MLKRTSLLASASIAGALALAGGMVVGAGRTASAQVASPSPTVNSGGPNAIPSARFSGTVTGPSTGATAAGVTVVALIGATTCGSSSTMANGMYQVDIQAISGCTAPGATVSFTVNGAKANETGTLPPIQGSPVTLNLTAQAATPTPAATARPAATAAATATASGPPAPPPPPTPPVPASPAPTTPPSTPPPPPTIRPSTPPPSPSTTPTPRPPTATPTAVVPNRAPSTGLGGTQQQASSGTAQQAPSRAAVPAAQAVAPVAQTTAGQAAPSAVLPAPVQRVALPTAGTGGLVGGTGGVSGLWLALAAAAATMTAGGLAFASRRD